MTFKLDKRSVLSFGFALLFGLSAYGKITHLPDFVEQLGAYELIPPALMLGGRVFNTLRIGAVWIILLEVMLGWGLLWPSTRRFMLRLASVMFFIFSLAMAFALLQHKKIDCGCFLPLWGKPEVNWMLVLRNIVLACVALLGSITPETGVPFWKTALEKMRRTSGAILLLLTTLTAAMWSLKMTYRAAKMARDLEQCQIEHPGLPVGAVLRSFPLTDLTGGESTADFSKKPFTFLFFFSATCSHCKDLALWWETLYQKHASTHQFLGIVKGTPEQVKQFQKETGASFPVYQLGKELTLNDFRVFGFPRTVLVDSSGSVRAFLKGDLPSDARQQFEATYLKEQETAKNQ